MPTGTPSDNPTPHTLYMREWRRRNKSKVLAYERAWRRANNDAACARQLRGREKLKREVVAAYGGACACCGVPDYEFLSIDHIHGGGLKDYIERFGSRGASQELYRWLKKQGYPKAGYRLLCTNCNFAIGHFGYCPHQRQRGLLL